MMTRVFFPHYGIGTSLQQIHSLFSQHAVVTKVYMPFDKQDPQRSKGYAFVSFGSKEDLAKVIDALHESQIDGRTVFVTEAKPRSPKSSEASTSIASSPEKPSFKKSEGSSTKLYVGNISYETSAEDLVDLFSPYGKVIDTYLPVDGSTGTPRGFAFVTISSENVEAAIQEIDGIELDGRIIAVNKPLPRGQKPAMTKRQYPPQSSRSNSENANTVKLYVGNLSFDTDEDDVRMLFERYGPLTDVYVPVDQGTGRRRGFAFVTLSANDAPTAIEETDGLEVDGRVLRVNAAQPRGA
jgi:nucleolin